MIFSVPNILLTQSLCSQAASQEIEQWSLNPHFFTIHVTQFYEMTPCFGQ